MSRLIRLEHVALLAGLPFICVAATWNVFEDGTGDAPTINAAMDSASAGDTVLVWPGTYPGLPSHVMAPDVHLISQGGPDVTRIPCIGPSLAPGLYDSGPSTMSTILAGFSFEGMAPVYGFIGSVYLGQDHEVRDCVFDDMVIPWKGSAMDVRGETVVHDCTFRDIAGAPTTHTKASTGIRCQYSSGVTIEDCVFEGSHGAHTLAVEVYHASATIRDCLFRDLSSGSYVIAAGNASGSLVLSGCAFLGNDPFSSCLVTGGLAFATVSGNTFADNDGNALLTTGGALVLDLSNNVFAQNTVGANLQGANTLACNVAWNNGTNWLGVPDPTGLDGNVVADPVFCDAANGLYTVSEGSPCLPQNSNGCGLIGAFGQGCGAISVETMSWGGIKGLYR